VRARAVRAGEHHHREGEAVGALLAQDQLHPPRELALGAADDRLGREALVRTRRDRGRLADGVQLAGLLHRAQALHEPAARHELGVPRGERRPGVVGHVRGLEPDAPFEELRDVADERTRGLRDLEPVECAGPLGVAEVGEEAHTLRLDERGGVRAREAGQVADVDEARDEQRLLEQRLQALDAGHEPRTRNSSASR
jgi:hypothetical protein